MVWVHVAAAAVWIGACACVAIAASAVRPNSAEFRTLALRVLPAITRLNLFAAVIVFIAGTVQLVELGAPIGYRFPAGFLWIFGAKMILFSAMVTSAVLSHKMQAEYTGRKPKHEINVEVLTAVVRRVVLLAGVAVLTGVLAAILGIWLAGTA
jgi:uncharacterized membrane protein